MSSYATNIQPDVDAEVYAAQQAELNGQAQQAFAHLERAHVLGQASTLHHTRVHWLMFLWALRHHKPRELAGQVLRIVGAATKTAVGFVPYGNTGGANVSPFKPLPVPADLQARIERAKTQAR